MFKATVKGFKRLQHALFFKLEVGDFALLPRLEPLNLRKITSEQVQVNPLFFFQPRTTAKRTAILIDHEGTRLDLSGRYEPDVKVIPSGALHSEPSSRWRRRKPQPI